MDAAETVVARRRLCLIASLVALVMCSGGALAGSEPVPPAATEVAAPVGHGNFLNLEARAAYIRTVVLQELALTDLVAELGADHPNVAVRLNDLAGIHHGWGERGRADLIIPAGFADRRKGLRSGASERNDDPPKLFLVAHRPRA